MARKILVNKSKASENDDYRQCETSVGEWICSPALQVQETLAQARLVERTLVKEAEKNASQLTQLERAHFVYANSTNVEVRNAALGMIGAGTKKEMDAMLVHAKSIAEASKVSATTIALRNQINTDMNSACAQFMRFYMNATNHIGLTPTRAVRLLTKSVKTNSEELLGYAHVTIDYCKYGKAEEIASRAPRGNWSQESIPTKSITKVHVVSVNRENPKGSRAKLCDKKWVGRRYRCSFTYKGNADNLLFAERSNKEIANDWNLTAMSVWADGQWSDGYGQIVGELIGKGMSDVLEGVLHQSIALPQLLETLTHNTRPVVTDTAKPARSDAKEA